MPQNNKEAALAVRIINASVDKSPTGRVIVRGSIHPSDLGNLMVAEYQREVLNDQVHNKLIEAIVTSTVPDIEVGCRSTEMTESGEGEITILGPTYIIDGLQRVSAGKLMIERGEQGVPYIGVVVFMDTTVEWERDRFKVLNMDRTKLSPNVILRNMSHSSTAVDILYRMSSDAGGGFPLADRICWQQRMKVTDLITASMFAKSAGYMHSHLGAGRSSRADELSRGLDGIVDKIGGEVFEENVRYFYHVLDECFSISEIRVKTRTPAQLTGTFLQTAARLFSDHTDFWRGDKLFVEVPLLKKLGKFPITDPNVASICSGGGRQNDLLFMMLLQHMNSGKRTRHLTRRTAEYPDLKTVPLDPVDED